MGLDDSTHPTFDKLASRASSEGGLVSDLVEANIIDAIKVVRMVLKNSVSVAEVIAGVP